MLNRYNYARNLSYHYADMCNMNEYMSVYMSAYEYLKEGGFTASLSGNVHGLIPIDQIIETTINRVS